MFNTSQRQYLPWSRPRLFNNKIVVSRSFNVSHYQTKQTIINQNVITLMVVGHGNSSLHHFGRPLVRPWRRNIMSWEHHRRTRHKTWCRLFRRMLIWPDPQCFFPNVGWDWFMNMMPIRYVCLFIYLFIYVYICLYIYICFRYISVYIWYIIIYKDINIIIMLTCHYLATISWYSPIQSNFSSCEIPGETCLTPRFESKINTDTLQTRWVIQGRLPSAVDARDVFRDHVVAKGRHIHKVQCMWGKYPSTFKDWVCNYV